MLIFSAKSRQVIDTAVAGLADQSQRDVWLAWSRAHPRVRRVNDPLDDGQGQLPPDVIDTVLAALEGLSSRMRLRRAEPGLSEDDHSDLDNDLSTIRSVEEALYHNLQYNRQAA